MNFLSSLSKSAGGQSTGEPKKSTGEESASTTELLASAKVLAEAAQSQINKDGTKVDNKKVAEAAADVLDASQKYGKLDENQGIGQYIEKAETYLHQYGSDTPAAVASADEKPPIAAPDTEEAKAPAPSPATAPAPSPATAPITEGDHEKEKKGGGSDYLKMAGDFFSKN